MPKEQKFENCRAIVKILSTAVILDILQSDNGGEFAGKCIAYLKQYFKKINIEKWRAWKPSTQGFIERMHTKCKLRHMKIFWIVFIAKNMLFAVSEKNHYAIATVEFMWDSNVLWEAETEYGKTAVHQVMSEVLEKDPNLLIKVEVKNQLMVMADNIWNEKDKLSTDEEREIHNAEKLSLEIQAKVIDGKPSTLQRSRAPTYGSVYGPDILLTSVYYEHLNQLGWFQFCLHGTTMVNAVSNQMKNLHAKVNQHYQLLHENTSYVLPRQTYIYSSIHGQLFTNPMIPSIAGFGQWRKPQIFFFFKNNNFAKNLSLSLDYFGHLILLLLVRILINCILHLMPQITLCSPLFTQLALYLSQMCLFSPLPASAVLFLVHNHYLLLLIHPQWY
jgi:hypothetical protein